MKNFKSGIYIKQNSYKSFQPEKINKDWTIENMELLNLLSQADRQLGAIGTAALPKTFWPLRFQKRRQNDPG